MARLVCSVLHFLVYCVSFLSISVLSETPLVCNFFIQQTPTNYTLCPPPTSQLNPAQTLSWCSARNVLSTQPILYVDPDLSCNDPSSNCVEPSYHPNSMKPACSSGNPNYESRCSYTYNSLVFELANDPLSAPEPYLALSTMDGFSIIDMGREVVSFDTNGTLDWGGPFDMMEIASQFRFINEAYIVGVSNANSNSPELHVIVVTMFSPSLPLGATHCSIPINGPVLSLTTIYDLDSEGVYIAVLANDTLSHYPIDHITECPSVGELVYWNIVNAVDQVTDAQYIHQAQPDHSIDVFYGCFPYNSSRTVVVLSSRSRVYFFGFSVNSNGAVLDFSDSTTLGNNLLYISPESETITNVVVFGECFGNVDSPSQALWLAVAAFNTTDSYLQIISLNEFALADFECDKTNDDWWLYPTAFRNNACAQTLSNCEIGFYLSSEGVCEPRVNLTFSLPSPSIDISTGFRSSNYLSIANDIDSDFMTLIFVATSTSQTIEVFGFQEKVCVDFLSYNYIPPTVDNLNSILTKNKISNVHSSKNGQHVVASLNKPEWEIESQIGFINVCTSYFNDTSNPFLSQYATLCEQSPPSEFTPYDYFQHFSQCTTGMYCPRTGDVFDPDIPNYNNTMGRFAEYKEFSLRPMSEHICETGFYCPGFGQREECPPGFTCPGFGIVTPQACEQDWSFSTTCAEYRLSSPILCPQGSICSTPNMPPHPAPPGYYVTLGPRNILYNCTLGELCPLRVSNETEIDNQIVPVNMDCIKGTYCPSPSVIEPTICPTAFNEDNIQINPTTSYCPEGMSEPKPCPVGYFCATPMNITPCFENYYCPVGSQKQNLCPSGYYCPTPTEQILCPAKHYCREGTTSPELCHILVVCPEGTPSERIALVGPIFDVVFLAFFGFVWYLVSFLVNYFREKRQASKKLIYESLADQDLSLNSKTHLLSSSELRPPFTINFELKQMGLRLKKTGQTVLYNINGKIRSGKITAVMGPSGSGKTTFLTTLAGKATYGERTGQVLINGESVDISKFKKIIGFVPQEDIMHRELTVKEIIRFCADTRLPSSLSNKERTDITNKIIQILGLVDVRHSVIGNEETRGCSGGQRKRVNIGMELVCSPTVLFLDEPTSGLDATSSDEVVSCLQKAASMGITVIAVLHQPRNETYEKFDDILLLGKGGKTVYFGPREQILPYFENLGFKCPQHTNPADFFMDVVSGKVKLASDPDFYPEKLFSMWERHGSSIHPPIQSSYEPFPLRYEMIGDPSHSIQLSQFKKIFRRSPSSVENKSPMEEAANVKTAGPLYQFYLFAIRACIQQIRDLKGFLTDCFLILVAGSLLGALYMSSTFEGPPPAEIIAQCPAFILEACESPQKDTVNELGMLVSLCVGFIAITSALRPFGSERVIFWREASTGINRFSYFLGKIVAQIPSMSITPVVFLSIFYMLTSPRALLIKYYVTLLMLQFAFSGYGYLISIILPQSRSLLASVVVALICAMFGGSNPTLKALNQHIITKVVSSISPNRWSQEAIYIMEVSRYSDIYSLTTAFQNWGFNPENWVTDILALFVIGCVTRFMTLITIYVKDRDKTK